MGVEHFRHWFLNGYCYVCGLEPAEAKEVDKRRRKKLSEKRRLKRKKERERNMVKHSHSAFEGKLRWGLNNGGKE